MLSSRGFIVQVARDGNEAILQMAHGGLPDIVLMDMQMPLADGAETIRRIRDDRRLANLRVYAVTGVRQPSREDTIEQGWDAWFSKPLDVPRLVSRIHADLNEEIGRPSFQAV